jgi:hypothetical protein
MHAGKEEENQTAAVTADERAAHAAQSNSYGSG